jgi:hypothetical protein
MAELGAEYARIFGKPETGTGRARLCKACGDWHSLSKPWPHNCRSEAPPRAKLAAPMLAPKFEAFVAGDQVNPVVINDPRDKRNYMDKHDLVEYDSGVEPEPEQTERQWREEFVKDFRRAVETDPLNRPPTEIIGRADLEGAAEIDVNTIEVAK